MTWSATWDGQAWAAAWVGSWILTGIESRRAYLVPAEIRSIDVRQDL